MSFAEALKQVAGQFSYYEETTFKTRPTNIDTWLTIKSLTLPIPAKETELIHAPGGGRAPVWGTSKRKWSLSGSFSFYVQTGEFLGAAIGDWDTTGADPYTHTGSVAALKPFAVAYGVDAAADVIMEFLGCKVDTAVLKAGEDEMDLMCDIEYKACVPNDGTSLETLTPVTSHPFTFKEGSFTSTEIWAGAKARIHDFELKISNNLKEIYAPGDFYPYDLLEGKQEYELRLTVGLEDDTEWDEVIDDTNKTYSFSIVFTRGANDTLTISGNAKLKGGPINIDDNDIRMDIELVPTSVQFVIVNSIATFQFS